MTATRGRWIWWRKWGTALLIALVVAAGANVAATSPTELPAEVWVCGSGVSRDGPDGTPDSRLEFESLGQVGSTDQCDGSMFPNRGEVWLRPSWLRGALTRLGIDTQQRSSVYRFTGDVRRWPGSEASLRAARFVREDCWSDAQSRYPRFEEELRAFAAGRMSKAELRAALDTVGITPCEAALTGCWRVAPSLDVAARGALVEALVEAIDGRVVEADQRAVQELIGLEERFIPLVADARFSWMERSACVPLTHVRPSPEVLRSLWQHWWNSVMVRDLLVDRVRCQPFAETRNVIDAVPPEGRATVSEHLRTGQATDVDPERRAHIAGIGLRLADKSWFTALDELLRQAESSPEVPRAAAQAAAAMSLRWVLDDALASRLLAGTGADCVSATARRLRWAEIADTLRSDSPGWVFDEATRTWRDPAAPAASPR